MQSCAIAGCGYCRHSNTDQNSSCALFSPVGGVGILFPFTPCMEHFQEWLEACSCSFLQSPVKNSARSIPA
eukprot:845615-Amphidinium_carterae.1